MNTLDDIRHELLSQHQIVLTLLRKRVKNINFRIKAGQLNVSAPVYASDADIYFALTKRLPWIISNHYQLLDKQTQRLQYQDSNHPNALLPLTLWGEVQPLKLNESQRIDRYRAELATVMPELFAKWQPIVGKYAKEQRIKKMRTRWGSCNTRAKRIWLSVYLPEYPLTCTEYVIVHELCHLHHANHSTQFWQQVAKAMPDYKYWHDMLAGKHLTSID